MCGYRVGIDIGGTFTDLVALNEETGELANIKLSSTPRSPADGVINAFQRFLENKEPTSVTVLSHATTIAVNALLGQTGLELPRTGLITTAGFRDVLEIGRQRRHELYDLFIERPKTLVPRKYRYEVNERVDHNGRVIRKLDPANVRRVARRLKRDKIRAVAIGLLYSYRNPRHEKEVTRILRAECPDVYVTASHEVAPEHREYERISTTVVNAVLMPIVSRYLDDLSDRTRAFGISAPLCVMQSSGGIAPKEIAVNQPVRIVESGPAAGVIASAYYGKLLGLDNIMSLDMGGTTAKAGAIRDGVPQVVSEYEVGGKIHSGRIVKGSGYPVRFPFIDLAEASAGGGTIAWVDEGGALRVGPVSAGADPGPACYGRGSDATVTDANLVLGRLNPGCLLGGGKQISAELARRAIEKKICSETGLGLVDAAAGIVRIVNSSMTKVLRIVSVERGFDPRDFILIAFGGAGPMHACAIAEELSIKKIIVPNNPGLFSAFGLLTADFTYTQVCALMTNIREVSAQELENTFQDLQTQGKTILESQNIRPETLVFSRQLDMRYWGQAYELTVSAPEAISSEELSKIEHSFHTKHESVYGYSVTKDAVELVNARLISIGVVAPPRLPEHEVGREEPSSDALLTRREVYFEKYEGYRQCPIYTREKLAPGNVILGPAVIEQYDATSVIYPEWNARINRIGGLEIGLEG
jgi:N-methylhydantoinase A